MRKSLQSLFAVSALAMLALNAPSQAASSGTITFNGELTQNTCDVNIDGQGSDALVILPTVLTSVLQSAGQTNGRADFRMVLSNCVGSLRTVAAFFEAGPTVDTVTGRLKNTHSGGATNVSLQLLDLINGYKPIQAGNQNQVVNTSYVLTTTGSANLGYTVQYYAEGPTTPGLVSSSVVYSLMYK